MKISPNIKITYVVRDKPIINDALLEDAQEAGINKYAKVITAGNGYPGSLLGETDKKFRKLFKYVDMVISKG